MNRARPLLVLGLCWFGTGCNLALTATHNAFLGPCEWLREHCDDHRDRYLARLAWSKVCCNFPDGNVPGPAYEEGFLAGYADYLKYGGLGEPPALPPKKYRHEKYYCPSGHEAVEAWFAGFRHGAQQARASGRRNCTTLPAMLDHDPCDGNPYRSVVNVLPATPPPTLPMPRPTTLPPQVPAQPTPTAAAPRFDPPVRTPQPAADDILPGPSLRVFRPAANLQPTTEEGIHGQ
jgi:hypothetical protein